MPNRKRRSRRPQLGTVAWRRLRLQALDRDGNQCTRCGNVAPLEAHHLDPHAGDTLNNLTTLCRDCHLDTHGRRPKHARDPEWDRLVNDLLRNPNG